MKRLRNSFYLLMLISVLTMAVSCQPDEGDPVDPATFTVTFNANGGTPAPAALTVDADGLITEPAHMTRTGFAFGGWFKEAALTNQWNFAADRVTTNITLYAKWNPVGANERIVGFDANGGVPAPIDQTVTVNSLVTEPAAMTKAGYTFGGWFKEAALTNQWDFAIDVVTGNITLYAKWIGNTITVTFDANGGTPAPEELVVSADSLITAPPSMTRAGFVFGGWFKDEELTEAWNFAADRVTASITLYAKWNAVGENQRTVTFEANGGTPAPAEQVVAVGDLVTAPAAMTKTGYAFGGWFKDEALTEAWNFTSDTVTVSITLYAKWNLLTDFDVKISNHDGTGTTTQQVIPSAVGGTVELIPGGFQFDATSGYGGGYNKFKVDFGTGNTFASIGRVKFTFNGISGDVLGKTIQVLASATEPLASINPDGPRNNLVIAGQSGGNAPTNVNFDQSINVLAANEAVLELQEVWFIVYIHSNPAVFSVTNIEFFEGTPCAECGQFPCECVSAGDTEQIVPFVNAVGGSLVSIMADGVGFRFLPTGNYNVQSYAIFKLDLGDTELSDYSRIEYSYEGNIAGATGGSHKDINFLISDSPFSGGSPGTNSLIAGTSPTGANPPKNSYFIDISDARAAALAGKSELYFSIAVNAEANSTYEISDVKLVGKGTTGSITIKFTDEVDGEQPLIVNNPGFASVWGATATVAGDGWVTWSGSSAAIGWAFPAGYDAYSSIKISWETRNINAIGSSAGEQNAQITVKGIANALDMSTLSDADFGANAHPWLGSSAGTGDFTFPNLANFGQGIAFQLNNAGAEYEFRVTKIEFFNTP